MVDVAEDRAGDEADERRGAGFQAAQRAGRGERDPDRQAEQREERVDAVRQDVDVKRDEEREPDAPVDPRVRGEEAAQARRALDRVRGRAYDRHRHDEQRRQGREAAQEGEGAVDAEPVGRGAADERTEGVPRRERGRVPTHDRARALATGEIDGDGEVVGAERAERVPVHDREEGDRDDVPVREGEAARRRGEHHQPEQELPPRVRGMVGGAARHARHEPEDAEERRERADRRQRVAVAVEVWRVEQPERALRGRHRARDDVLEEDRPVQTSVAGSMSSSTPASFARSSASIHHLRMTRGLDVCARTVSISAWLNRRGSPIA